MDKEKFMADFRDSLGTSLSLTEETKLSDIPEWDSLSIMSVVTLLASEYGTMTTFSDLKECAILGDIMKKAGLE